MQLHRSGGGGALTQHDSGQACSIPRGVSRASEVLGRPNSPTPRSLQGPISDGASNIAAGREAGGAVLETTSGGLPHNISRKAPGMAWTGTPRSRPQRCPPRPKTHPPKTDFPIFLDAGIPVFLYFCSGRIATRPSTCMPFVSRPCFHTAKSSAEHTRT
jgi:hypothetical protein